MEYYFVLQWKYICFVIWYEFGKFTEKFSAPNLKENWLISAYQFKQMNVQFIILNWISWIWYKINKTPLFLLKIKFVFFFFEYVNMFFSESCISQFFLLFTNLLPGNR